MRQSCRTGEQVFAFDCPEVRAFFRRRHPQKAAHHLAAAAWVSERAAQKWLDGTASPNWRATFRLIDTYGPEFVALVLPGAAWVSDAATQQQRTRLRAEIAALDAELAALPVHLGGEAR